MAEGKQKRKAARVKIPIRQAHEMAATFVNVRAFCGMYGASSELMEHISACERNMTRAINERDRLVAPFRPKLNASASADRPSLAVNLDPSDDKRGQQ